MNLQLLNLIFHKQESVYNDYHQQQQSIADENRIPL